MCQLFHGAVEVDLVEDLGQLQLVVHVGEINNDLCLTITDWATQILALEDSNCAITLADDLQRRAYLYTQRPDWELGLSQFQCIRSKSGGQCIISGSNIAKRKRAKLLGLLAVSTRSSIASEILTHPLIHSFLQSLSGVYEAGRASVQNMQSGSSKHLVEEEAQSSTIRAQNHRSTANAQEDCVQAHAINIVEYKERLRKHRLEITARIDTSNYYESHDILPTKRKRISQMELEVFRGPDCVFEEETIVAGQLSEHLPLYSSADRSTASSATLPQDNNAARRESLSDATRLVFTQSKCSAKERLEAFSSIADADDSSPC